LQLARSAAIRAWTSLKPKKRYWAAKGRSVLKRKKELTRFDASWILRAAILIVPYAGRAGEGPFFVTYTRQMEEPGNLEIATKVITGRPAGGSRF
jgi:hypothetical protein